MRKALIMMLVVLGAIAMIVPSAALADWDQGELSNDQLYNSTFGHFGTFGFDSQVGYDVNGDGTSASIYDDVPLAAPDYTSPCPNNLGVDSNGLADGGCPANDPGTSDLPQTATLPGAGFEANVILDDLYQKVHEQDVISGVTKLMDQELDIAFYVADTKWIEPNVANIWNKRLVIDQTLDQDVADGVSTTLTATEHVAQTLYMQFEGKAPAPDGTDAFGAGQIWIDQWLLQSMYDTWTTVGGGGLSTLAQSYSSWVSVGAPINFCNEISNTNCKYTYGAGGHGAIDKTITSNTTAHETAPE